LLYLFFVVLWLMDHSGMLLNLMRSLQHSPKMCEMISLVFVFSYLFFPIESGGLLPHKILSVSNSPNYFMSSLPMSINYNMRRRTIAKMAFRAGSFLPFLYTSRTMCGSIRIGNISRFHKKTLPT